jgi:hypothetical protein
MELHMTKEEYDNGLKDLQVLANDRNRAVAQRDAAMKRAIQQQQQAQQQQAMAYSQQQQHHWSSYLQSQFGPPLERSSFSSEQFNASCYQLPAQPVGSQYPANVRRSLSNLDVAFNQTLLGYASPGHSVASAAPPPGYDFLAETAANHHHHNQTPPYFTRSTNFTLPPSPLSQTSSGAAKSQHDGGFSTSHSFVDGARNQSSPPIDRNQTSSGGTSHSFSCDSMWSMLHHGDATSAIETPSTGSTNPFHGQSSQTTETSPMSSTTSHHVLPPPEVYTARGGKRHLATQNTSTLSGLKRDFESANLHAFSPVEQAEGGYHSHHSSHRKRFAGEPNISGDLKHFRISSSSSSSAYSAAPASQRASQSPTEKRYSLRSQSRPALTSRVQRTRSASKEVYCTSVSPRGISTYSRSASPAHQPGGSAGLFNNAHLSRSINAHEVYSSQQHHQHRPDTHPSYHSVFTSALTPNTLAAPLENPMMDPSRARHWNGVPNSSKKVGPLQYYSLAAGEPFGNIATYVPPPPFNATRGGHNTESANSTRRSSMVAESPTAQRHKGEEQRKHWIQNYKQTPHTAPFSRSSHGGMNAASEVHGNQRKDHLVSSTDASRGCVAPFTLDVDAWPLNSSTSSNFCFPYHLLSLQPPDKQQQRPYHDQAYMRAAS